MVQRLINVCVFGGEGHGNTTVARSIVKKFNPSELDKNHGRAMRSRHYNFKSTKNAYSLCHLSGDSTAKYFAESRGQTDGAVLVVSAVDGVLEQTDRQVSLARSCGVPVLIPYLSKCDLVTNDRQISTTKDEMLHLVRTYGYPSAVNDVIQNNDNPTANDGIVTDYAVQTLVAAMDKLFKYGFD